MLQTQAFHQAPTLRPLTTAHLAQTMALLELPAIELQQKIEAELSRNPALELKDEKHCPICHRILVENRPCPYCNTPKPLPSDEPIIFVSPKQDFFVSSRSETDELPEDNVSSAIEDLSSYVMRQIALELDPQDRLLAAHLLTSLNE